MSHRRQRSSFNNSAPQASMTSSGVKVPGENLEREMIAFSGLSIFLHHKIFESSEKARRLALYIRRSREGPVIIFSVQSQILTPLRTYPEPNTEVRISLITRLPGRTRPFMLDRVSNHKGKPGRERQGICPDQVPSFSILPT